MRLIPDCIAGESPRSPNPDEEITLGLSQQITDGDEQDAHEREHSSAHLEILIAEAPGQRQPVDVEHEGHHQRDEQVESLTELRDVRFEGINPWNYEEQYEHSKGNQRHQKYAPESGDVTVHLIVRVPVGCHLIGELIPK